MPFSDQSAVLNPASSSAQDISGAKFVVGIMSTPDTLGKATRLLASCKAQALAAVLYEAPTVHCSTSVKGSDDLSYTRPSFIRFLLQKYHKPLLYLDPDCLMAEAPSRIFSLVEESVDFAIYNWLADEQNDGYLPVNIQVREGWSAVAYSDRYYHYSHGVDIHDPSQLMCSSAVQFWNDSDNARELLIAWQRLIERNPRCAGEHALDFVFNYRGDALPGLKTAWLDKGYVRFPWWIYVKPVIDHPATPGGGGEWPESLEKNEGVPRFDYRKLKKHAADPVFPRDCMIDTVENRLVRSGYDGSMQTVGPLPVPIWITRDEKAEESGSTE